MFRRYSFSLLALLLRLSASAGFVVLRNDRPGQAATVEEMSDRLECEEEGTLSRRSFFRSTFLVGCAAITTTTAGVAAPPAWASQRPPLDELLYRIVRAREATQQETRLITTGKFKDVQRANVKLAVKFIVENYRLNDAFVAASTYLDGDTNKRLEAGQVGQKAVQNLYTILEYFDSADVQNIKVGESSMAGKEDLVLRGLKATRKSMDEFLAYFPKSTVDGIYQKVEEENALNKREFDPSLGTIINPPLPE
jgi:hypothetical protein